jgi:hypothetical protein
VIGDRIVGFVTFPGTDYLLHRIWSILVAMSPRQGRVRWAVAALLVAACFGLVSCASSGYNYVKSSVNSAYLKVPSGWKLYDQKELLSFQRDLSEEQRDRLLDTSWQTAFDASPDPSVEHVLSRAAHPAGLAMVSPLSPSDSDGVSDSALRNLFFPVDEANNDDRLTVLDYEIIDREGGFHGVHIVARMVVNATSPSQAYEGKAITFDQIALVDQERSRIYAVAVACSAKCYEKNNGKISQVVDSWTVKEED